MTYEKIFLFSKFSHLSVGSLKLKSDGLAWKNAETAKVSAVPNAEIKSLNFVRSIRDYELRIEMKTGAQVRLCGFRPSDRASLRSFVKDHYAREVGDIDLDVKGHSWGTPTFQENTMKFVSPDGGTIFSIPLSEVSQATQVNKTEVGIELRQDDSLPRQAESLIDIRFVVPEQPVAEGDETPSQTAAEEFYSSIMAKADIAIAPGREAIATFPEVNFILPRARNTLEIFDDGFRLHGKTHDYRILFAHVQRLFMLPKPDGRHVLFVVSLEPPIRQGQTLYPNLVLQFENDDEIDIELNLDENLIKEKFPKLERKMNGTTYELISAIFRATTNKKITIPKDFKSRNDRTAIKSSYKSNDGYLYPLERGFIFVHKPTLYLRFDEIQQVEYYRLEGTSKSFDVMVTTKAGHQHEFRSIPIDEYKSLHAFMKKKNITLLNEKETKQAEQLLSDGDESDDDEGIQDPYLRMKAGVADDDDDSDDESFQGGEASDVAEEFDSNASSSNSDSDDEGGSSSKKRKRESKPKATSKGKGTKKKKKKDPNAPKRPANAYFLWTNANRDQFRKEYPDLKMTDFGRKLGELWNQMSATDKEPWTEKATADKARYQAELAEYEKNKPPSSSESSDDSDSDGSGGEGGKAPPKKRVRKAGASASKKTSSKIKSSEYVSSSSSSGDDDNDDE